jgi:hypothetical protein
VWSSIAASPDGAVCAMYANGSAVPSWTRAIRSVSGVIALSVAHTSPDGVIAKPNGLKNPGASVVGVCVAGPFGLTA